MKRKWFFFLFLPLAYIWVKNTSLPGKLPQGCFQECAVNSREEDRDIIIISLNMLHGFPKFNSLASRLEILADELIDLNADIVMLQEVPWTFKTGNGAEFLAKRLGMNYEYLRANGNRWTIGFEEGEAILSRYPLTEIGFIELDPKADIFENRIVLSGISNTPIGKINLFVTHLSNENAEINFRQASSLKKFVEGNNSGFGVVSGDFNAKPDSSQILGLSSEWIDAISFFDSAENVYTCCIDNLFQQKAILSKRIDYIFLPQPPSSDLIVRTQKVFEQSFPNENGWLWVSDHVGLLLKLTSVD
jgi:endonuclease/exonuclease/phosphatase family metal-dependent hydrolase